MRDSDTAPQEGVISYEEAYRNRATKSLAPLAESTKQRSHLEKGKVLRFKIHRRRYQDTQDCNWKGNIIGGLSKNERSTLSICILYIICLNQLNERFLPWHRIDPLKFEEILNNVMKKETGKDYNIAIPYWDQDYRDLPEFLKDLTPTMNVEI